MNTDLNFVEDPDLRKKLLQLLEARLELIKKDNLTPIGLRIQTGILKIEL